MTLLPPAQIDVSPMGVKCMPMIHSESSHKLSVVHFDHRSPSDHQIRGVNFRYGNHTTEVTCGSFYHFIIDACCLVLPV